MNRVVITGLGIVSPIGSGLDRFWEGILEARSGAGPITRFDATRFPVQIAAEVKDFEPERWIDAKTVRRVDPFTQYALASAGEAVEDSGLDLAQLDPLRVGCVWASGIGGLTEIEEQHARHIERGPGRISPFFIPKMMINAACGHIAIRFGICGPNYATTSACASAMHALGAAFRHIQHGEADVMITGGSEATVTELGIGGFCALKALSTRNATPETASRPFDRTRDGFLVGEGAGALIFEAYDRARERGAPIYAEVLGFGMTDDGHHMTAPMPDGKRAADAIRIALRDGRVDPERVQYVNAHGTSTPLNDTMETKAIRGAFGPAADNLVVSSTKSQIGHLLGASAAVETVATALAIRRSVAPATINYQHPDPACDLDYVPNEPRELNIEFALSNSFGFGGHNATILLGKA